ncbi:MAG: hypothetical protein WAL95_13600 [Candidatus Acidiferrales bacterium]
MLSINQSAKELRFAGLCLAVGLLIEALCLIWATPVAFIVFVVIGGLFIIIGLVAYLHSQLSPTIAGD